MNFLAIFTHYLQYFLMKIELSFIKQGLDEIVMLYNSTKNYKNEVQLLCWFRELLQAILYAWLMTAGDSLHNYLRHHCFPKISN